MNPRPPAGSVKSTLARSLLAVSLLAVSLLVRSLLAVSSLHSPMAEKGSAAGSTRQR